MFYNGLPARCDAVILFPFHAAILGDGVNPGNRLCFPANTFVCALTASTSKKR